MAFTSFLFVLGVLMLWGGSEFITRNIGRIARAIGVKELVITVLGVSVLSSLPELTISVFAMAQPRAASWMILSSAFVLVLAMDGRLSRSEGMVLMLLYVPYVLSVLKTARAGAENPSAGHASKLSVSAALWCVLGIFSVIAGSKIALDSGGTLGVALGIPPLAMGVLLFAFGTSLPELTISLSATFKRKSDVTIGEVYASNIFTQLIVLGICCLIRPMTVDPGLISFAMPFLILASVVIQIFVTTGRKVSRIEAVGLLGFYAIFAVSQFRPAPSIEHILGF